MSFPWNGPVTRFPPLVVRVLRTFKVPAVHTACGYKDTLNARWVMYANGRVNCETRNKTCPGCLSAGVWWVDMEAARSYYNPKWGKIGAG